MTRSVSKRVLLAVVALGAGLSGSTTFAANEVLGETRWVAFDFCPRGYAEARGQLLSISLNSALFSLLGTTYGGDGRTTFALPDLRGRTVVSEGQGAGLTPLVLGQGGGAEHTALTFAEMASHPHAASTSVTGVEITSTLRGSTAANATASPAGAALGLSASGKKAALDYVTGIPNTAMASGSVQTSVLGGTATTIVDATTTVAQPFPVRNPYLAMRACIALTGVYPARP